VEAHAAGKQFRVVVVDGRPWLEGKEQLRRLAKHGIECSYILINALSFIMPEVNNFAHNELKNLFLKICLIHKCLKNRFCVLESYSIFTKLNNFTYINVQLLFVLNIDLKTNVKIYKFFKYLFLFFNFYL